jgi:hypothetical protein
MEPYLEGASSMAPLLMLISHYAAEGVRCHALRADWVRSILIVTEGNGDREWRQ